MSTRHAASRWGAVGELTLPPRRWRPHVASRLGAGGRVQDAADLTEPDTHWGGKRTTVPLPPSGRGRQALGPGPHGNRMFFERTNSYRVSAAFSRPKPLPLTPPNGEPRNARRM